MTWRDVLDDDLESEKAPDGPDADYVSRGEVAASVRYCLVTKSPEYPWVAAARMTEIDRKMGILGYFARRVDAVACAEARAMRERQDVVSH
jgi:hypothetical protein